MPERATVTNRSEKSAEAVVLGSGTGEVEGRRGRAEGVGDVVRRMTEGDGAGRGRGSNFGSYTPLQRELDNGR